MFYSLAIVYIGALVAHAKLFPSFISCNVKRDPVFRTKLLELSHDTINNTWTTLCVISLPVSFCFPLISPLSSYPGTDEEEAGSKRQLQ